VRREGASGLACRITVAPAIGAPVSLVTVPLTRAAAKQAQAQAVKAITRMSWRWLKKYFPVTNVSV